MVENCTICGSKLEDGAKFCPECGEKVPPAKETKEVQTKTRSEAKTKKKKTTNKFSLPKLSMKNIPKPMIIGIALLCIAIIAVAGVVVISPFNTTGSVVTAQEKGDRVFSVNIENTCDSDAKCYLTVGGLTYIQFGNNGEFTVPAGETMTVNIVEDVLPIPKTNYDITLFAALDHLEKGTAIDVTESAGFSIYQTETDGEFFIENTDAR